MSSTLSAQHVVVAGGSSGIGLATARAAAAAGAAVTVIARDRDRLDRASAEVAGLRTAVADVLDEDALREAFAQAGRVDHVVVTAGTAVLGSLVDGPAVPEQLAGMHLKVAGAANVVRAAHPVLRPDGSVVLTGGVSTDRPVAGAWTTSVATAAVEQLARALALDLAPLRVNAVAPGWTPTPMWDAVLGEQREAVLEQARASLLTGRLVDPEDVAQAVLALLANPSITGSTLHVDGGGRLA